MKKVIFNNINFNEIADGDAEFIPLITPEDEAQFDKEETPEELAILPLRNTVLFPGVVIPITLGRDQSIKLIEDAKKNKSNIGVIAQKKEEIEDPNANDLHEIGTIARVMKTLKMPDGSTTAIIQGTKRFVRLDMVQDKPYFKAKVKEFREQKPEDTKEFSALISSIKDLALEIIKLSPNIPSEAGFALKNITSNSFLVNFISSNMNSSLAEKQSMLEVADLSKRAEKALALLNKEHQMLELKNDIQSKVRLDLDKQQRDYFLNQQLKTIQDELGGNPHDEQVKNMRKRLKGKKWNKVTAKAFEKELSKLERINPAGSEYSVQLNYCELLLDLPWDVYSTDKLDMKKAQEILDRDHYGMEKVKGANYRIFGSFKIEE